MYFTVYQLGRLIQPTISLEMPVPSQDHYSFHSFPVVDWFCLFICLWVLTFPLLDCSEFGNFVITLIWYIPLLLRWKNLTDTFNRFNNVLIYSYYLIPTFNFINILYNQWNHMLGLKHISRVPWCIGLDRFRHPGQSDTFPWSLGVLD